MRIINVEQGSIEWHELRSGNVTGTRIESAIGAKYDSRKKEWKVGADKKKQQTLLYELVSEKMSHTIVDDFKTRDMERGNELEPFAIKAASTHTDENYETCGMLESDIEGFRYSPDSIVLSDDVIIGGIETKCPTGKKHIEYMINDEVPKEYFWQVLGPMILDDCVQWWDFCSYDDRNYTRPTFTIRTERKDYEELIMAAREEIKSFIKSVNEAYENLVF